MRILLDECLPWGLRHDLGGHDVTSVQRMGWSGTKNGALLPMIAQAGFSIFLTMDRGIEYQQRIVELSFGVIALRAHSNDIVALRPLMPAVLSCLSAVRPGQLMRVP